MNCIKETSKQIDHETLPEMPNFMFDEWKNMLHLSIYYQINEWTSETKATIISLEEINRFPTNLKQFQFLHFYQNFLKD